MWSFSLGEEMFREAVNYNTELKELPFLFFNGSAS